MISQTITTKKIELLKINPRNSRKHNDQQIHQLMLSILTYGFTRPLIIDENDMILAGHGARMGAIAAGMTEVPCIQLSHLTDDQKRAYVIADNKLAEQSEWDESMLFAEMDALDDTDIDFQSMGFKWEDLDEPQGQKQPEKSSVQAIPVTPVADRFWIAIQGPLIHQADALHHLRKVMAEFPIEVKLGTIHGVD